MDELIKLILGEIPKYLSNFVNVLVSPREFARHKSWFSQTDISAGLVFLGISLSLTLILKIPLLPKDVAAFSYLAADGMWKIVIVLIEAGIIYIAWRLMGGTAMFVQYLIANCYYFGVLTVIGHLILLTGHSLRKATVSTGFSDLAAIYYVLLFGALGVWCLICWRAYSGLSSSNYAKAVGALVITILISIPALIFGLLLKDALVGKLYQLI